MAEVVLFSARACPYAHRTRLVLSAKQVDFEIKEIDLKNKPSWFDRNVSGYGKVPAIEHAGRRIWESAIINEYLDEVFPKVPLLPSDPGERARARILIDYANTRFAPAHGAVLRAKNEADLERGAQELIEALKFLDEALSQETSGPYFSGASPSLVDFTFYPWFERWGALEFHRGLSLPRAFSHLTRWRSTVASLSAVKAQQSADAYYIERYASFVGFARKVALSA